MPHREKASLKNINLALTICKLLVRLILMQAAPVWGYAA
jgi:hypothetical protein